MVWFASLALGATLLVGQELPSVKDWAAVHIRLFREPGFCACPSYNVEISDGLMRYWRVGDRGVRVSTISRQDLQWIVDELRLLDYMRLESGSGGQVLLDGKADVFFVSIDGQANSFADYGTEGPSETRILRQLEDAIDRMVNAAGWVDANEGVWINPAEAMAAMRLVGLPSPRRLLPLPKLPQQRP